MVKENDADDLEIIFVSSDRDSTSFNSYYKKMPWLALPFNEASTVGRSLGQKFGVSGIPTLVILDGTNGKIKDREAVQTVASARGSVAAALRRW
jgi:nucleoredoxin